MDWYEVTNSEDIPSPALLIFPDRIEKNIDKMIDIAGNADRLRPHVKTHKLPQVVDMQLAKGITKFKCATIAEAEMLANQNVEDVLLAMQPVGPHAERLFSLVRKYSQSRFSCLTDNREIAGLLSKQAEVHHVTLPVWIDINNGMNRTGIEPGEGAIDLFGYLEDLPNLEVAGLHIYDGHIHESDSEKRKRICEHDFRPVIAMVEKLKELGYSHLKLLAGGTPTFPIHAQNKEIELCPGTTLLWDQGYADNFPDLEFYHAAVLLTRVVSKPHPDLLCLDLGHKAVASEMQPPRVEFLNLEHSKLWSHNEEHMVVKTVPANPVKVGDVLYGIPTHICPTVDRQETVFIVKNNEVVDEWPVVARKRKLTI